MKKIKNDKNYYILLSEGVISSIGVSMVPFETVAIYIASLYVSSKMVLGLLSAFYFMMIFMPQIIISRYIERLKKYKKKLVLFSFLQKIPFGILAFVILGEKNEMFFIISFYVVYAMLGLLTGINGALWVNYASKVISEKVYGSFLGIRATMMGLCGFGAAYFSGFFIKKLDFPNNYMFLFLVVFIIGVISTIILFFLKEDSINHIVEYTNFKEYLLRLCRILKKDKNFQKYLFGSALILIAKATLSFQIVYAKDIFFITPKNIANTVMIWVGSKTLGNIVWGTISDKYGFKAITKYSAIIFSISLLITTYSKSFIGILIALSVFGFSQSARDIEQFGFVVNLCIDKKEKPNYIGIRNTVIAPIMACSPVIIGTIIDIIGYKSTFVLAMLTALVGAFLIRQVHEYRGNVLA